MVNFGSAGSIRVPEKFAHLAGFRRWTKSTEYPHRGEFAYLNHQLHVDLTGESLGHNQVKLATTIVLGNLVSESHGGYFFTSGMRLVNERANFSTEPDGMFASFKTMKAGLAQWEEGADSLEVVGTPDMVLEVVSTNSVQKDTVELRELYANAGIREYWIVDRLKGEISFEILRLTGDRYVAARKSEGWSKSSVFGRSFRMVAAKTAADNVPEYRLQVR